MIPNYTLVPRVTGKDSFIDCEKAYDWVTRQLPNLMCIHHGLSLDTNQIVTMGYGSGGTIALHNACTKSAKAVVVFSPSLYVGDASTSIHSATTVPPFGMVPSFTPTEDDWAAITPAGKQLSEAPLTVPGTPPSPRTKWQLSLLKNRKWIEALWPDGDDSALGPLSRARTTFPPTMIVQGEIENAPGSDLGPTQRALRDLEARETKDVHLNHVPDAGHMFDLPPMIGTSDLGPRWQAVLEGLQFLEYHASH